MSNDTPKLPAVRIEAQTLATRAANDAQIVESWLDSLGSPHTRRNFERTAAAFLGRLRAGLRGSTVEDVREALAAITEGAAETTSRQYALRVKSLLSYAHRLGYTPFNAGVVLKVKSDTKSRGSRLAKRIVTAAEVGMLIRGARTRRDRILIEVLYAGGLRVSELVGLSWEDVIPRDGGQVQLAVRGKGDVERQVLLPAVVSRSLVSLREGAAASDPVFVSRKRNAGGRLTERGVLDVIKSAARAAKLNDETAAKISPHWLRHAHASHAIDGGATLPEVQSTLGHANVATTSGYLHARPDSSSGMALDQGVFLR